jgi:hypothetical protein
VFERFTGLVTLLMSDILRHGHEAISRRVAVGPGLPGHPAAGRDRQRVAPGIPNVTLTAQQRGIVPR